MTTAPVSNANIHRESVFEDHITASVVANLGYIERKSDIHYDKKLALDTELLFQFIRESQPVEWQKLVDHYSGQAEAEFLKRLEKALSEQSTHVVLREGVKLVPNLQFSLCYFKPASNKNPELTRLYNSNLLSVMRQVKYSTKNENSIDLVFFVNGIPFATMEVKNHLTGQNYHHAIRQYKNDRSPAGEPLLTFKRGAIVHFAVDQDYIAMTTRLMNGKTYFLPFNRGQDGGAGNPDIAGEYRVAYLYQNQPEGYAVFSREVMLDIIGRFIHLERDEGKERVIFPRYQQLDAVRRLLANSLIEGTGKRYLIQHSAGSGKSNTIAWLAHQIINLHDADDVSVFDTAIIVTDRRNLDKQLQDTIGGFAHVKGVVKTIDGTSRDLKDALNAGARIIVTTIQKFGTDHLAAISGLSSRKFAVIIDEAHSSQSGRAAQSLSDALTRDDETPEDVEEIILKHQAARGQSDNISYFAFTATPRNVTLERFGRLGADNLPHPFHLYSMRQAIDEGFILDVLANYTTYKAYFQLEKTIEDDPKLEGRRNQAKVARFASLEPTAIDQKVEVIIEHFRRHVQGELDGKARAMVVTQSREHALRYWQHINDYIKSKGYNSLKAIVAFSGELDLDGQKWTEADCNGFAESELPERFDDDKHPIQILVVAEKYQTGFDQPKLVGMYVDKKLDGLQAVQTLSRLNRTHAGKKQTYVLDFQNSTEDIKSAFAPYFETTALTDTTDLNQIYDLESRIRGSTYIAKDEVERFAERFFKGHLTTQDRLALEGLVRQAVARFELDEDESQQEEFRQLLRSYQRFYAFVAQMVNLKDAWLEKLYVYASWLSRLLPERDAPASIEITDDMLKLSAFRLKQEEQGSASLTSEDGTALAPITEFGANPYTEEEVLSLSEVISSFNDRHGTNFTREDFLRFEQVNRDILNEDMSEMIRNNPADVVFKAYSDAFLQGMVKVFQQDQQMRNVVMTDKDARERATRHFFKRAQRQVKQ